MVEAKGKKQSLAIDSNYLFDLAAGQEWAHDLRELLAERHWSVEVPPTVVQELAFKLKTGTASEKQLARTALERLRNAWGFLPFDLKPVGHGITETFVRELMAGGLLPEDEWNDGQIIAETALRDVPLLLTSDKHLLDIPHDQLASRLIRFDLPSVLVIHPKGVLKILRGCLRDR
jgi:predicted nucleic acid-binding protein